MQTSLVINDREYIPLNVAADLVGRSETYIQQLAQGKWVNASCIQGYYYVDVDSLVRFIQMLEEEESGLSSSETVELKFSEDRTLDAGWVILGKTGVVVLSGLLLGVLIYTVSENAITIAQLRDGLLASVAAVGQLFGW